MVTVSGEEPKCCIWAICWWSLRLSFCLEGRSQLVLFCIRIPGSTMNARQAPNACKFWVGWISKLRSPASWWRKKIENPGTPAFYVKNHSVSVVRSVKLLLMQTEHFLKLQLHIKSIQLAKHMLTFIFKWATYRKCNVVISLNNEHYYQPLTLKTKSLEKNNSDFEHLLMSNFKYVWEYFHTICESTETGT